MPSSSLSPLPLPTAADLQVAWDRMSGPWVECSLGDFTSLARGKRVHREDFHSLAGCKLPSVVLGLTLTAGESDQVFGSLLPTSYVDMHLRPDLATLAPRPGRAHEATVICEPAGRVFAQRYGREVDVAEFSPRAALRAVLARLERAGLKALVAPELELFLLSRDTAAAGALGPAVGRAGALARESACEAFSLERAGHFEAYFDELYAACEALGIPVNGHAHESAWSQYEVNFRPGEPLAQTDAVFRFKRLSREIAARHGFIASYAPKPFLDQPGTGMHWHFSLQRRAGGDWPHVFGAPGGEDSPELGHFIAGLQQEAAAAMAFFAPYDMSYDRIALSDASPSHACWGHEDRACAFRIPGSGASSRRVENRLPGGDANPYLTVAATLGLGLLGLEQRGSGPVDGRGDALALPRTLPAALDALGASTALRQLLGDPLVDLYVALKRHEHAQRSALADPRQHWDLVHLVELA